MASLVTLPNEMQDVVIEYLTSPDLISLALTCKHFHALALPKAYEHLSLTWTNAPDSISRNPRLRYLHRTLDSRADLVQRVKHLTLATSGCISFNDEGQYRIAIPSRERQPDLFPDMMRLLRQCSPEGLEIAVELFLGHQSAFHRCWITLLQEKAVQDHLSSGRMRKLRHVRTTCELTKYHWESERATLRFHSMMFFMIPSLETLDLAYFDPSVMLNEDGDELDEDEIIRTFWTYKPVTPAGPEYLHRLKIRSSSTRAMLLEITLQHLPNLRVFDISLFQHPSQAPFDLRRLKLGLEHVQTTLTHLHIRYEVIFDEAYCEDTRDLICVISGSIGSLRDFAALTHLEISLHTLFGSDDSRESIFYPLSTVLPPNLEVLTITDDLYQFNDFQQYFEDDDAMKIFKRFLEDEDWKTATPNLKSFTYDLRERGNEYTTRYWDKKEMRDQLERMIKAQGLEGTLLWTEP